MMSAVSGTRRNRGIRLNKGFRLMLPSRAGYLSTISTHRESPGGAWCRDSAPRISQSARGPLGLHGECHREISILDFCMDGYGNCQASKGVKFNCSDTERQRVAVRQGLAMIRRLARITMLAQDLHLERAKRTLTCS